MITQLTLNLNEEAAGLFDAWHPFSSIVSNPPTSATSSSPLDTSTLSSSIELCHSPNLQAFSALLLVLILLQATLPPSVSALTFEGDYKCLTVSSSMCAAYSCNYRCTLAYKITVSRFTVTLYPTTNPSGCVCETPFAAIISDTAMNKGSASIYAFKRTSTGLEIVAQVSSMVCIATYIATSSITGNTDRSSITTSTPQAPLAAASLAQPPRQ